MAQGYHTLDNIDLNEIWYAAQLAVTDMYQKVELPIIDRLVRVVPPTITKYIVGERNGFQIIALDTKPTHQRVVEAAILPVTPEKHGYGIGSGLDTLRLSTGREVMNNIDRGFNEDPEHVLRQILKRMMVDPGTNNAGYGFWNGQFASEEKITAPPRYQMNTFQASHNHYYISATAAIQLPVITAAKQTIRHHGSRGKINCLVNSDMVRQFENLAEFTASSLIRSPVSDRVAVMGFEEEFDLLGVHFISTEMIPPDYLLFADLTEDEARRPVVQFEYPNLPGLRLMPGPMNDYPLVEAYLERFASWKVANRSAGVVVQIKASGSFDNPSF